MKSKPPKHIAIIMDGNGRWAQNRNHNRVFGHIRGAKRARQIIEHCSRLGVKNLTLYAFSTENWFRPEQEVSFLMNLLVRQLKREKKTLLDNNIKFNTIGEMDRLHPSVQDTVKDVIDSTASCTGMNLVFAISYGGRQEITQATKLIAAVVKAGRLDPNEISETVFSSYLQTTNSPDPELIIRTSGESRLSNFLLWQAAYSEIYITDQLWPDFTETNLNAAIEWYSTRKRRFGRITETSSVGALL